MDIQLSSERTRDTVLNPNRFKAAATYDAAADSFDAEPLSFWDRHGRRTVELLDIMSGERVLDVGCGTGASALPAAAAVGVKGSVNGIDVSEKLIGLAREKAGAQQLSNVSFQLADMMEMDFAEQSFDAVISVFSIFFVTDMERQTEELWRFVRPGGRLAITVWSVDPFEPGSSLINEEVKRHRPDITIPTSPWKRLADPADLRQLFLEAGTAEPKIQFVPDCQPLREPADFWTIAMGSGFRGLIEQMTPDERIVVRERVLERLSQTGITEIESGAICAIAHKPH